MIKLLVTAALLALSAPARADWTHSPDDPYPQPRLTAMSVELLGRGGLYTLNVDHMLSDQFAVGVGFSYWTLSDLFSTINVLIIPVYGNFYFNTGPHRAYLTGGLDIAYVSASDTSGLGDGLGSITASGVGVVLGGGYEFRGDGGFLFRASPYFVIGSGGVAVTGGLSFGYAF
jgi:hypothetical protein